MKIKKGDQVIVISGDDYTKKGKVLKVFAEKRKILVEGINLVKKNVRPKKQGEKGQIIQMPKPISVSNAKIICPKCGKPTKIGYRIIAKSEKRKAKSRICKKCGQEI
ncbi:MAG: 50S ribosomal protein L24 [Candidatus Nealsonbacteria bacterium CG02_land_8_20_14_3_00_34_20]|uniref:Large ribosomal subunit protein uL24 n=1 Tax=Candidatus Nealsonbacteria bacterium CG02_land_8_20_14_3_00_34_20 TaxID=1974698 RepID=A0A2M7DB98_9BACT|nr:MAG: 50S ribosomal protein L24 [Candidatus Nealsonbacteria bacterium CG02_land_8_20_14_3_00_34_20]